MKRLLFALPLLLVACGQQKSPLTVTVSGVGPKSLPVVLEELSAMRGVSEVRVGQLKDGQATFTLRYAGKGGDLAASLVRASMWLRNVKSFDDASLQIVYAHAGDSGPAASATAAPPATTPVSPSAKPAVQEEKPKETAPKEVKVEVKKDPLAYRVHQLPGGTIATFDGWKVTPLPGDGTWTGLETHPEGKENDFQMLVFAGTPGPQVMANLFEEGRKYLQQIMPALRPAGEAQKCTIGGDEARLQDYTAEIQGRTLKVQSLIIRKKDVAVSLLALGSDEAFKEFGRAVGITAQSITVKEEPPDPALVGTWLLEKYYSSGTGTSSQFSHSTSSSKTIYPNGTFTESSFSATGLSNTVGTTNAYLEGGDRGRVVKRGNVLTFTYDNGKVWNAEYKLDGGALVLNGNYWMRQR